MARKANVRQVQPAQARAAQSKAEEFAASAIRDLDAECWNAAGLAAVHAGISASDAALIASCGLVSTSQDHGAVVALLEEQVGEYGAAQRRQLLGLLKMKNTVSYEQRLLTETEARQMVDQARRLSAWSSAIVEARLR